MPAYQEEIQRERSAKDEFMARHPESPFRIGDIPGFQGLAYFEVDPAFRVGAKLRRQTTPPEASLRTNQEGTMTCRYVGDMEFELLGQRHSLRVFHAGEQVGASVFIPFRDATCGNESYGPGRYLILQLTEDDRYTLDFNLAFNPYCAYTDRFECGFPPPENDLAIPITAGEMAWTGAELTPIEDAVVESEPRDEPRPRARAERAAKTKEVAELPVPPPNRGSPRPAAKSRARRAGAP